MVGVNGDVGLVTRVLCTVWCVHELAGRGAPCVHIIGYRPTLLMCVYGLLMGGPVSSELITGAPVILHRVS
jgi:precorrin isomerase